MAEPLKFSSPLLIKRLQAAYGSEGTKRELELRKSKDLLEFLKAKEKQEKESRKTVMFFQ